MTSTPYTPILNWNASHSHTAATDETVVLSNIGGGTVRFDFDAGTTLPTIDVEDGHPIKRRERVSIGLQTGQTLFWAGPSKTVLGVLPI